MDGLIQERGLKFSSVGTKVLEHSLELQWIDGDAKRKFNSLRT